MASPMTASPAGSPAALSIAPSPVMIKTESKPEFNMKMDATTNAPGIPSMLGPTKEWVLPPRPKPGRKPATDTPPTKRKAQNRAAQRAFRERRAARVGELEEQLKETEEDRLKRERAMHDKIETQTVEISRLQAEVERFLGETTAWRDRYMDMKLRRDQERREKDVALVELRHLRIGSRSTGTDAVPLPPRRSRAAPVQEPVTEVLMATTESTGCGNCSPGTSCACIDAAIDFAPAGCERCSLNYCKCLEETLDDTFAEPSKFTDPKRPRSPIATTQNKRQRTCPDVIESMEVDFTRAFSSRRVKLQPKSSEDALVIADTSNRPSHESCGFCEEGSYCMCAEAVNSAASGLPISEPRLNAWSEVTPPPSDTDVTLSDEHFSLKLAPINSTFRPQQSPLKSIKTVTENPCVNGPGTCQQCQADPKAGLFCRSLANMRNLSSSSDVPAGCCGGGSTAGGCCKTSTTKAPPMLNVADTYKTLSSHKNFEQASDDLGTWLPKLHTVAGVPNYPGRAPLDIEAASVMNVIKYFDVRFGKN